MKYKILILCVFAALSASAQITFTAPVAYVTGAPAGAPSASGSRLRVDLLTNKIYQWQPTALTWNLLPHGITEITGCAAPAYTPTAFDSPFAINKCTPNPELYYYFSGSWHKEGGTGGGGSGTVETFTFADGNGFNGTVTNPTTTPELSLETTVTGIIYGGGGDLLPVTVGGGLTFSAPTLSAVDVSETNEIQTLSYSTPAVSLSLGGGSANLSDLNETVSAGTGISVNQVGQDFAVTNTAPDQTVTITGATGTYPNFSLPLVAVVEGYGTDITGTTTRTVTVDTAQIATLYDVSQATQTINAGTGISVSQTGQNYTVTNTGDLSSTNELNTAFTVTGGNLRITDAGGNLDVPVTDIAPVQAVAAGTGISVSGTTTRTISNTSPDQTVTLTEGGIVDITGAYPNFTISANEVDGSTTNELQTLSVATNTATLSNGGGSVTIAGGGINTVGTAGTTITITGTEVDGLITNEGIIGVGAGGGNSATIISNTSTATGATVAGLSGILITETTSSNGGTVNVQADTSLLATIYDVTSYVPDLTEFQIAFGDNTDKMTSDTALIWQSDSLRLGINWTNPTAELTLKGSPAVQAGGETQIFIGDVFCGGTCYDLSPGTWIADEDEECFFVTTANNQMKIIGFSPLSGNYTVKFFLSGSATDLDIIIGSTTYNPTGAGLNTFTSVLFTGVTEIILQTQSDFTGSICLFYLSIFEDQEQILSDPVFHVINRATGQPYDQWGLVLNNTNTSLSNTMQLTTTGARNFAFGRGALGALTVGNDHVALGDSALNKVFNNSGSVAIGNNALRDFLGTGNGYSANVAIGYRALEQFVTGNGNIGIGDGAARKLGGGGNTFIGQNACGDCGTVLSSLGVGSGAMRYFTGGNNNTAYGAGALRGKDADDPVGFDNVAVGSNAGYNMDDGQGNLFFGNGSGLNNTDGNLNTYIGTSAGGGCDTCSSNVMLGRNAGFNNTRSNTLWVENSTSTTPLIGGDFINNRIGINRPMTHPDSLFATLDVGGTLRVQTLTATPTKVAGWSSGNIATDFVLGRGLEITNDTIRAKCTHAVADHYTDANNTGTGETDLYSYTLPANYANANGDKIRAEYGGTFNDITSTGQLRVYFDGVLIGDTGALTMSVTGGWKVDALVIRTGNTTGRAIVNISTPGASTAIYTSQTDLTGLDFTATSIFKITGTAGGAGGGSNDITAKLGTVTFTPKA